eukprot:m.1193700 g.1193700  ORF g.1193700 m.1193700 type:complete len:440 (-) comp24557_c0_seq47:4807-6126(-)
MDFPSSIQRTPKAYAAAGVLLVFLLISWSTSGPSASGGMLGKSNGNKKYNVMIDAGSTGSRVHVYCFDDSSNGPMLEWELFEQLKPGLSSFKDSPADGAESLVPLIDKALGVVPPERQAESQITVKATAGLRMLQESQADALLQETRNLIARKYKFAFDKAGHGVEIMDGLSEALFGWVTINYLQSLLTKPSTSTAVVLDLGGGSTQIAMGVKTGKGSVAHRDIRTFNYIGTTHQVFVHSFLGYGLMAGRKAVFEVGNTKNPGEGASACVPPGTTAKFTYGDDSFEVKGIDTRASGAKGCMLLARAAITAPGSEFTTGTQPQPEAGQPVYAMSYYFDRAVDAGFVQPGAQQGTISPSQFQDAAERVCGSTPEQITSSFPNVNSNNVPFICMDLCFISSLLVDGFGLSPETPLHLSKTMQFNDQKVETQWTLGAALYAMM